MNTEVNLFKKETKKLEEIKIGREKKISSNFKFVIAIKTILIFILFSIFLKIAIFKKKNNLKLTSDKTTLEKVKLLKMITNNDEKEYKGIKNCLENDPDMLGCIYPYLTPKEVIGKKRILLGKKRDGCYVLLDDLQDIKIAYSFGIANNIIFDEELAKRGIDVYMYDHTINRLPSQNEKYHWKKIGICGMRTKSNQMKPLDDLIIENGHTSEKNMILKMDVEFWEFESIIDTKEEILKQFKFIVVEYHFRVDKLSSEKDMFYKAIKKLYKTHQPFYIRCNGDRSNKVNFGNNRICMILEVCYVIRKGNSFKKDEAVYPMYEFDYSVILPGKLEMNLNILKLFE
jgi:hypothetical protein